MTFRLPTLCMSCKRWKQPDDETEEMVGTCEAFPDGIPKQIGLDGISHLVPFPGDHGILYDPDPAKAGLREAWDVLGPKGRR